MRRTARGNRIGLAIVGVVLLLVGIAALLRAADVMPGVLGSAQAPVLDQQTQDIAGQAWFWPVVALVALIIGLLALRWLAVQGRSNTVRQLRLESDNRRGATRLPADAATDALEDDLTASPYLQRAQARLRGSAAHPRLDLSVTMAHNAEPSEALDRTYEALDRYRQALDEPDAPATVRLRVAR